MRDLVDWKWHYEAIEDQKPAVGAVNRSQGYLWAWFNYLSVSAHIITWTLAKGLRGGLDKLINWMERVE